MLMSLVNLNLSLRTIAIRTRRKAQIRDLR
nr:MAG TPA: hypothetical protein [Bacteriophage sp.]